MARNKWWVPARSYVRIRAILSKTNETTSLTIDDNIAPAMNLCANIFRSVKFFINDVDVTGINDYLAQIDTLENRMTKSKEWLDNMGAVINWWDASFTHRLNDISSDGIINDLSYSLGNKTVTYAEAPYKINFPADSTIATTFATNLLTFASATVAHPDIREILSVGDTITLPNVGGGAAGTVTIATFTTALTCTVVSGVLVTADVAAAAWTSATVKKSFNNTASRRAIGFELLWQPQISIFKTQYALPLGKYELQLFPYDRSTYEKYAIESIGVNKTPGTANDFLFLIKDLDFYVATMNAGIMKDGQYVLDLDETVCNTRPLANASGDLTQEVSPSTYALTVAIQDSDVTSSTLYSSSLFKNRSGAEKDMRRLQLQYADESKPTPISDLRYTSGGNDYYTQRYMDTNLYNGMMWQGSPESYDDWLNKRGPYFYFPWPKDGSNTSSTVTFYYEFGAAPTKTNLLLFHHKKRVVRVKIEASQITSVNVFDR
jgi:hypothetical protein